MADQVVAVLPDEFLADRTARGLAELRRFYLDVTSAATPSALPSILAFADPARLLYGTDFPHAGLKGRVNGERLLAYPMSAELRAGIIRENGLALSGRFRPTGGDDLSPPTMTDSPRRRDGRSPHPPAKERP